MSSIKKVIAIASGKGGVGKSLVTSLMAVLLRRKGYNTAILDADITGPSIPKVFGITDKVMGNDEGLVPNNSKTGIKIMSSNLMLKENTDPIVWRGPIIANLVKQFWTDVIWQDIDFMFVDMPPGTGDVPLTVFQSLNVDGIIIVTSPQELVSMIVSKAVKMAKMMNIPVLGLVENMSYLECDECNHQIKLFGESHVAEVAKEYGLNVLAKMPLDPKIAALCDKGKVEDVQTNHLDNAVLMLEDLPINVLTVAVPILDGKIDPHLGKATSFYVYQVVKNMVINGYRFELEEAGINSVIEKLKENEVSVVMVTQMGEHIMKAMTNNNIAVVTKASGDPLTALHKFLGNELTTTTVANCACGGHHEEEEHEDEHNHNDDSCGCENHDEDSECGCGNHDEDECGCGHKH
jgi:Mrp family chromosome partitioning ATPase/predicted Fe-Mo cluster-binding NifX family protein